MLYDTTRASKAPDVATYEMLVQKLKDDADYAVQLLKTCADPQKLGIAADVVIGAVREDATKRYTEFSVETAEHTDWIISLVAMIPCIQVSVARALRVREADRMRGIVVLSDREDSREGRGA